MITIAPAGEQHFATLVGFVEAMQEYERAHVPDLKPGVEIGAAYAATLMRTVQERNGLILLAQDDVAPVGFACAWVERDNDPLLRAEARRHAYVSDLFVRDTWRRQGIGRMLLDAIEARMGERGCRRIRVCSKAANVAALSCYQAAGYRPYEIVLEKPIAERKA